MAYYYLHDGTNTFNLDDNVQEIELGGAERNFEVVEYAGSNGGYIRGIGNYNPKKFVIARKERAEGTDGTAWNSRRNDLLVWYTKSFYDTIFLYQVNGENTLTMRTRIYPKKRGADKFKFFRITDTIDIEFVSPSGIWELTTATTGSLAITGASEQSLTINNTGIIEAVPDFSFTPTAAQTSFRVQISDKFGFKLTRSSFEAGVKITYCMKSGKLYFGSSEVDATNYLLGGSPFQLKVGNNTVYVQCSGAGLFEYSYNARYI